MPVYMCRVHWSQMGALLSLAVLCASAAAELSTVSLERGFHLLYNLDFGGARDQFAEYQRQHADDPMGPMAEAAGLLFCELNRLGILRERFFAEDSSFRARSKPKADPVIHRHFDSALRRAEALAQPRLARDSHDRNALLALTLVNGLKADYSALIENSNLTALHYTRDATTYARRLLTICPDCYDAYIATGISRYLIGSTSAPVRWILRMDGFSVDKPQGMADLRLVSDRGRYLAPYARIWLASAYIREKNFTDGRQLLIKLRDEFPGNPLFTQELARLDNATMVRKAR
jgi:hypothetical protein